MQPPFELSNLLNWLEGAWTLQRTIEGHGNVTGSAEFIKKSEHELLYREKGIHIFSTGKHFNIYREYMYSYYDDEISVYFIEADQKLRLFYTLKPVFVENQCIQAIASHLCNQDTYDAVYSFMSDNEFILQYKVTGPAKNYTIETRYSRQKP